MFERHAVRLSDVQWNALDRYCIERAFLDSMAAQARRLNHEKAKRADSIARWCQRSIASLRELMGLGERLV
eukprot:5030018-Prymnesium_polylepis.1